MEQMLKCCVVVGVIGFVLGGCMSRENTRLTVGEDLGLPVVYPEAAERNATGRSEGFARVDRSTWERATFVVPVDGTSHGTLAVENQQMAQTTARQRREYPTAEEALVLGGGRESGHNQAGEVLWGPVWQMWQAALAIPRMVIETADGDNVSPRDSYDRVWVPNKARFIEGGGDDARGHGEGGANGDAGEGS